MKVNVSIAKIKAWIKPTKISKNIKGNGIIYGVKKATTRRRTSPAKIFPKSLKEKDKIFTDSEINSKKLRINFKGLEKFKNLFIKFFSPKILKEKYWTDITDIRAKAIVVVRSLFGERNREICSSPWLIKIEPKKPGNKAKIFAVRIKIKKVAMSGSIFILIFSFLMVLFIKENNFLIIKRIVLTKRLLFFNFSCLYKTREKIKIIRVTKIEVKKVLVIFIPKREKIYSDCNLIFNIIFYN